MNVFPVNTADLQTLSHSHTTDAADILGGGLVSAELGWESQFDADGRFIDGPSLTVDQLRALLKHTLNTLRSFEQ